MISYSISCLILVIYTGVYATHVNSMYVSTRNESIFISSTDDDRLNLKTYYVRNIQELERDYADLLSGNCEENIVFAINETGTFLSRHNRSTNYEDKIEKLSYGDRSNVPQATEIFDYPFNTSEVEVSYSEEIGKQEWEKGTEWYEFSYTEVVEQEYPGYIPISACQSQELGQSGSVGFSYSFGTGFNIGTSLEIDYTVSIFTLSLTIGQTISISYSITGSASCKINSGTIGQIFIKPFFVSAIPLGRIARWSKKYQKLLMDPEFRKYKKVHYLLKEHSFQLECATNDIVSLFCEGYKLGELDWEHPLGLKYNKENFQLANSKTMAV